MYCECVFIYEKDRHNAPVSQMSKLLLKQMREQLVAVTVTGPVCFSGNGSHCFYQTHPVCSRLKITSYTVAILSTVAKQLVCYVNSRDYCYCTCIETNYTASTLDGVQEYLNAVLLSEHQ